MNLVPGSYPRPQLVRPQAVLLDREVEFAFDDDDRGLAEQWFAASAAFPLTIRLPYAPESRMSGVGDPDFHPVVWYRIALSEADLDAAGRGVQGGRAILHLGAVDHSCDIWVDGTHVATHTGGQTAFAVDITAALAAGRDVHWVTVRAHDDPLDVTLPRGKQDWHPTPHAIWYHRTTGIWRTVWLEYVPDSSIVALRWTTDPTRALVTLDVSLDRRPAEPLDVEVVLSFEGVELARGTVRTSAGSAAVHLDVAYQRNGQAYDELTWSADTPRLWDAEVSLRRPGTTEPVDEVRSYLGYRCVAVERGRFLLNDRPCDLRGVLEQGYWPDSHFTAPGPDALRAEVELIKSLGFNAVRVHQKVEDPRFLYWCDRLGLLVWAETANAYEFSPAAVRLLTREWMDIVDAQASHPCVVTWVPMNESWGVQHGAHDEAQRAYSAGLANLTRALDPTRPVVSNDGWEHTDSDILTIHDYEASGEVMDRRYADATSVGDLVRGMGPFGRRLLLGDAVASDAPVMVTEFGGIAFDAAGRAEDGWGYSQAGSTADFLRRLEEVVGALRRSPIVCGFFYTQLTDTAQEINGLCDENRVPKAPAERIRSIVRGEPTA